MNIVDAVTKARLNGHELKNDPPIFSSMSRMTCINCGRAVLASNRGRKIIYGSALEEKCIT